MAPRPGTGSGSGSEASAFCAPIAGAVRGANKRPSGCWAASGMESRDERAGRGRQTPRSRPRLYRSANPWALDGSTARLCRICPRMGFVTKLGDQQPIPRCVTRRKYCALTPRKKQEKRDIGDLHVLLAGTAESMRQTPAGARSQPVHDVWWFCDASREPCAWKRPAPERQKSCLVGMIRDAAWVLPRYKARARERNERPASGSSVPRAHAREHSLEQDATARSSARIRENDAV